MKAISRRVALTGVAASVAWAGRATAEMASGPTEKGRLKFAGLNVAGAEFGKVPGRYTFDYFYPSPAELENYRRLGFNFIRLPFRWERIQPEPNGKLSGPELERLKMVVGNCKSLGLSIALDLHNYARRKSAADGWKTDHLLGSPALPADTLQDVWARLAPAFSQYDNVSLGLMNEPYGLAAEQWLDIANRSIAAIRARGAENLIFVPGIAYTGAHSWMTSGNTVMSGVVDPGRNFAIEVHQYLDADSSGTTGNTVSPTIGSQRIEKFEYWARKNGLKAFLGEFAAADTEDGLAAMTDMCRRVADNPDVWLGWAAWAAGSKWPKTYHFRLEPDSGNAPQRPLQRLAELAREATG